LGNTDIFTPVSNAGRFLDLLKLLPRDSLKEKADFVIMNDYSAVRNIFSVSLPSIPTKENVEKYIKAMYGMGGDFHYTTGIAASFISGHDMFAQSTSICLENIGFNLFNVDADIQTINIQDHASNRFSDALIGRYDPVATARSLTNQTAWSEVVRNGFASENYRDTIIYSWGDGSFGESLSLKPPILDKLGRALPLAVTKSNVFYSDSKISVKSMIDASISSSASLADIPEYQSAAKGLSKLGAYCGIIGNESLSSGKDFLKDTGIARRLHPYRAFGSGAGRDFLGPYMALVLVHDTNEQAAKNVDILIDRVNHTKWIQPVDWEYFWRLYVDYIQIQAEGNVIYAKLYGDRGQYLWERWLFEGYPVLLHE
jgi:hypothetical protein